MSSSPQSAPEHASQEAWRARVGGELGARSFEEVFRSRFPGDITIDALGADLEEKQDAAGWPGLGSQVRAGAFLGPKRAGACAPLLDEPDPQELNALLLEHLAGGATAAHVVLERGARLGEDFAPDPAARGLALASAATFARALEGIEPNTLSLSLDAGANARGALALLAASGALTSLCGLELGHDPLAALALHGRLPASLEAAFDDAAALLKDAREPAEIGLGPERLFLPLSLDARPWYEAGADPALSLGLMLADAAELLRALEARGIAAGEAGAGIALRLSLGPDVFGSIALLRAARLSWTQLLVACGTTSLPPTRLHAFQSERSLARREPMMNILRTTSAAFASQTAAADRFTPLAFDRALGAVSPLGRRIARNVALILDLEGHLTRVLDPGAGSGHIEARSEALARKAWAHMQEIEGAGGLAAGLANGGVQARIAAVWRETQKRLRAGDPALVGVSLFPPPDPPAKPSSQTSAKHPEPRPASVLRAHGTGAQHPIGREFASLLRAARAGCDLATLSPRPNGSGAASAASLPRVREAALFEEEGAPALESDRERTPR